MPSANAFQRPSGAPASVSEKSVVPGDPSARPTATRPARPSSFSTVNTFENIAPAFTPTTLTALSRSRLTMATAFEAAGPRGMKKPR